MLRSNINQLRSNNIIILLNDRSDTMAKDLNDNKTQDLLAVAKTTNADRQKAYRENRKALKIKDST